jgi:hypothetical protein
VLRSVALAVVTDNPQHFGDAPGPRPKTLEEDNQIDRLRNDLRLWDIAATAD